MGFQIDYCKPFIRNGIYYCEDCMEGAPYLWCCKMTCGEMLVCKGCDKGIYDSKEVKDE